MYALATINPHYAARLNRPASHKPEPPQPGPFRKVQTGPATLYNGNCFDIMPSLGGIEAAVTDPPYCIGFQYRSYDDAPENYHGLMTRLVPELIRLTDNGSCFVWQSPMKANQWHRYFPKGYLIIAGCKIYPKQKTRQISTQAKDPPPRDQNSLRLAKKA